MFNVFTFDLAHFVQSLVALVVAFVLGTVIGYERQFRQRTAGLRTNTLVAVAAAAFVDMAFRLDGAGGAIRVASYVVSGVGFLGAGAIMKEGINVRGLNTAATLWGSAAVGAAAGVRQLDAALLCAILVLAANTLLRPLVNAINRQPISDRSSEVTWELHVVVDGEQQKHALALIDALLDQAQYPLGDMDIEPFGDDDVEITATLLATSANSAELERIARKLSTQNYIKQAFWNSSTME
ncbi:putative Mg2+ transporter-C (MgtC) family protein [Silvimonas terrae]|uniref:Protein MgtC n=1 Tax=Silvimonas terrae TaxID=300266 RepID=A0A840R9H1_9NEIS|nr:MgtC/SapB family protein [Silvimonas terrae]MBB5190019.1 putative Mg2+ transporter-C (MgtC) family protein [Silvimonas terrae]